jgi:hypothetical protein
MCSCLQLRVNASLRYEIIRTEYEFIRLMELRGKLGDYRKVLHEVKYTWGLCPECDQKLRAFALEFRSTLTRCRQERIEDGNSHQMSHVW